MSPEEYVELIVTRLDGRMLRPDKGQCRCPAHDDNDPSLSVKAGYTGKPAVFCRVGCTQEAILAALTELGLWDRKVRRATEDEIQRMREREVAGRAAMAARAEKTWAEAVPIRGTPAANYLRNRGITGRLPDTLRFVDTPYRPGFEPTFINPWSVMVARVDGGKTFAVQLTYLERWPFKESGTGDEFWRKAFEGDPRASFGTVMGGAVRLSSAGLQHPLVVAEGVETALSLPHVFGVPMTLWAGLSAANLKNVVLPALGSASRLIVAADNDEKPDGKNVGVAAALELAERARAEGWTAEVIMPPTPGTDYNDVLMREPASSGSPPKGSKDQSNGYQLRGSPENQTQPGAEHSRATDEQARDEYRSR